MRGFESVKELLRPFVDSKDWDFCVIWKLGDDPSRFMEWVDCCCSGGYSDKHIKLENHEEEEEEKESKKSISICRDKHKKHPIRALACEALSHFPLFMPLYPGIHGEVVMSKLPKWLLNHQTNGSTNDIFGTRVLIPVNDGLVELFSTKLKPVNQTTVDTIISCCNAFSSDLRIALKPRLLFETLPEQTVQNLSISGVNISLDGSSSGSNPSIEAQPQLPNSDLCLNHQILDSSDVILDLKNTKDVVMRDNDCKANTKLVKENYKSKNILTERNRRYRINQGIYALRALVPKITKMDKAGTLSDAIDYIYELRREKQKLEDELKHIDDMEYIENIAEEIVAMKSDATVDPTTNKKQKNKLQNVNLEVHKIGERGFLIRVSHQHNTEGFERLMEALESTGLEIMDVNFARLNDSVMNVINVKVNKDGIAARKLRDVLFMMITSDDTSMDAKSMKRE